jgi:hypothetical protein
MLCWKSDDLSRHKGVMADYVDRDYFVLDEPFFFFNRKNFSKCTVEEIYT